MDRESGSKKGDFKNLNVWNIAIRCVKRIYLITKKFSKDEIYGLSNQMRRAAVSISSNIAEGNSRQSIHEYIHFIYVALGSLAELETQVIIARELSYMECEAGDEIMEELNHIARMLRNLVKSLRERPVANPTVHRTS